MNYVKDESFMFETLLNANTSLSNCKLYNAWVKLVCIVGKWTLHCELTENYRIPKYTKQSNKTKC